MSDFNITLFEACELLNRSKKSISRYVRKGRLHPEQIKSQQGTLEYRFSKEDLEAFKTSIHAQTRPDRTDETRETGQTGQPEQTGHERQDTPKQDIGENKTQPEQTGQDQTRQDTPDRTRETGQDNEVITLLKETTGLLKDQLQKKDEQIKDLGGKIDQLIERDRETNVLLKGLQDKVLMLEQPREPINGEPDQTGQGRQDTADGTGRDEPEVKKTGFWQRLFKKD